MKKISVLLILVLVAMSCKRAEKTTPGAGFGTATSDKTATTAAVTTTGTDVGATMPDYSATYLDGTKFDLAAKRDKILLLNVWATWCGPCREEVPALQVMHDAYAARGFEVIGVSVDESGVEPVKEFADQYKMRYPIVMDPQGNLANILATSMLPTSVLVGRDGKILWKRVGAIPKDDAELKQAIEKAL